MEDVARNAIETLNGMEINGYRLMVAKALEKKDASNHILEVDMHVACGTDFHQDNNTMVGNLKSDLVQGKSPVAPVINGVECNS